MMNEIIQFGTMVSSLWEQLIKGCTIDDIIASVDANSFSIDQNGVELPKTYGVYVFFIQPSLAYEEYSTIQADWELEGFIKCPKVIKSRFRIEYRNQQWIPFYIGKSEDICKRVNDHLHHKPSRQTYGMKLLAREEFLMKNRFKIGYWALPENPKIAANVKQFIITDVESKLRDKLQPWVGKQ